MSNRLRLDIQGLRALAVTLVVVFHLAPVVLPGGYIGVDVFFVISGFLITGHLLREVERFGRVRLAEFWARRVRRLLPAALLVLLVSAVAVCVVLPSAVRVQGLTEIAFAAGYLLNWRLAADSVDYLAADNVPSIVQHYWSLSVEEQFYLVWPLLMVVVLRCAFRVSPVMRRRVLFVTLGLVFVASLVVSVVETARSQPSAYFVTTTRAWEFAVGGLVAMVPLARLVVWLRSVLSWVALAVVVVSAFLLNDESSFPGWVALFPVLASAVLLWLGGSTLLWSPQRILSWAPVKLVGDASYSVYLWHWPIIIVVTAVLGRRPGWVWAIVIAGVTLMLAVVTQRFVEDPVRLAPGMLSRVGPTFASMAVGMGVVFAVTFSAQLAFSVQERTAQREAVREIEDVKGCFGAYALVNGCRNPYTVPAGVDFVMAAGDSYHRWIGQQRECSMREFGELKEHSCEIPGAGLGLVFVGDSHAKHVLRPVMQAAEQQGWHFRARMLTGCTGFETSEIWGDTQKQRVCVEWAEQLRGELLDDPSAEVILFSAHTFDRDGFEVAAFEQIRDFLAAGKRVVVLRDVPGMTQLGVGGEVPKGPQCVERAGVGAVDPCAWVPEKPEDWLSLAAQRAGADVIDTWELVCSGGPCHAIIGGVVVYFDDDHLSDTFAATMSPWISQRLREVIAER